MSIFVIGLLSFNTQPPEGGCVPIACVGWKASAFQHTAARRRLVLRRPTVCVGQPVSTHSRPKAAGGYQPDGTTPVPVSTHSRPKAAGAPSVNCSKITFVSTHSRPKAAGTCIHLPARKGACFNTQPPEGGWSLSQKPCSIRFRSPNFAKLPRKARTRV